MSGLVAHLKITGNATMFSFAAAEELAEKHSPFDSNIQTIDGATDNTIDDKVFKFKLGEGIIIPTHAKHSFNARAKFKMISTVIKKAYGD